MSGTGKATNSILIINSEKMVAVQSVSSKSNLNTTGHGDIASDNVEWHADGLKEYTIDVEYEQKPGMPEIDFADFTADNPVDIVVTGTNKSIRYVQGVIKECGDDNKKGQTSTSRGSFHQFKERVPE